jgi:hypothetical protein
LQALANAADQAASFAENGDRRSASSDEERKTKKRKRVTIDAKNIQLRVKKKTKPDPTPRNPFPDVVTKGLVSEAEARELWDMYVFDASFGTDRQLLLRVPLLCSIVG